MLLLHVHSIRFHSWSLKIRISSNSTMLHSAARLGAKVVVANLDALDRCWAGVTIKRQSSSLQSLFIIRRNKLDAFDVAAA
jgi:hypothetical protein